MHGVVMAEIYDEEQELYRYASSFKYDLMTPLERRAERLAMFREKARDTDSPGIRKMLLKQMDAEADKEALRLIGDDLEGVRKFQAQVATRIDGEIAKGRLLIHRCPACNRIVKTPLARQCLWCGHDWHAAQ
jgi:rRNA maturation endonuclease Nob1